MTVILTLGEARKVNLIISECRFGGEVAVDSAERNEILIKCQGCDTFATISASGDEIGAIKGVIGGQIIESRKN